MRISGPERSAPPRQRMYSRDLSSNSPIEHPCAPGLVKPHASRGDGEVGAHLVEVEVIRDHGRYPSPREHVGTPARHNHRDHTCASQRLFTNRRAETYMEDSVNRPSRTPRRGTAAEHRRRRRTSRSCSAASLALRRASMRPASSVRRRSTSRASRSRPRR
jgi:hypothetical protein